MDTQPQPLRQEAYSVLGVHQQMAGNGKGMGMGKGNDKGEGDRRVRMRETEREREREGKGNHSRWEIPVSVYVFNRCHPFHNLPTGAKKLSLEES